jgi:hypothetical protein
MGRIRTLIVVAVALVPTTAWPQGNPVGPEFLANTYTTGAQRYPVVAAGSAGSTFVVVWASGAQDGSGYGVFGQRYDASGAPLGSEFRVNTNTTADQEDPAVAADPLGNFVVVWQSTGQDGSGDGIFGQRYDSSGAPIGPEFRVNAYTTGSQTRPAVAADGAGDFVVVWQGGSPFDYDVFGQRYASSGTPVGPEFRVNTYVPGGPAAGPNASISSDSSGNFVVAWQGYYGIGISGQRYSNTGVPLGPEFVVVESCLPCSTLSPSVASDSAGNFVVVWSSNYPYGPANNAIAGQRYASSGAALGGKFQVSTYEAAYQTDPAVDTDASGNFVVVWASAGQDGSAGGVFGRRYLDSGAPLAPEFRVNSYTAQAQRWPSVAADPLGNFVVVWQSAGQDQSDYGVFGQRYNMIVPVELMHFHVE